MENFNTTPLIGPIIALLRSRKFLIAAVTLIVDIVIAAAPEFEAIRVELMSVFTVIGGMLISAIAYEDGQAKSG